MPLTLNEELSVWFPSINKKAVFEVKYLSELTTYSSRVRQGSPGQVACGAVLARHSRLQPHRGGGGRGETATR